MSDPFEEYNATVREWNERFGDEAVGYEVQAEEFNASVLSRVKSFISDSMTARQRLAYTEKAIGDFARAGVLDTGTETIDELSKPELAFLIQHLSKQIKRETKLF